MEQQTSTWKAALKHGAILSVALIILSIIMHLAGIALESWSGYLSWLVMIAYLVYATKNFRDEHRGGYLKYGNGLGFGVLVSLIAAIVTSVYTILYVKLINPEFVNEVLNQSYDQMLNRGMDDEQIQTALGYQEQYMIPGMLIGVFFGTIFMGFIFSLIISAVFKRTEE